MTWVRSFKDDCSSNNIQMDFGEEREWGEPLKKGIIIRGK